MDPEVLDNPAHRDVITPLSPPSAPVRSKGGFKALPPKANS
jgi:hypothetical protein